MPLTTEQWQRVKELFAEALAQPVELRTAWLREVCHEVSHDSEVRIEVESLLASHEQSGKFIQEPLAGFALTNLPVDQRRGQVLGAWRLVEEIGRGGMGTVWRAERADGVFEKSVALKIVSRGMDTDLVLRRFHRERQILASLNHPNITTLVDGGTSADGLPYFVMELVEGSPITTYCRDRALGLRAKLELFCAVCDAVEYAHRNRVLHRDLKPSNILVTPEGVPKLLDFGIAKVLTAPPGEESTLAAGPLLLLTPEYASPEQARAEPVSERTDVYSLGVLLYELVAERRPYDFRTRSPHEIVAAICDQEPAPPSVAARQQQLKGDLDSIVMMALRKEPRLRYGSAQELAADLRSYLAGQPVRAVAPTLGYRLGKFAHRHVTATSALILAVALLGGGLWLAIWRGSSERPTPTPILTRLTSDAGLTTDPAVSRDGKLLAYASDRGGNGNLDIWAQPVGGPAAVRLTSGTEDDRSPSFSPDGTTIAFERDGGGIFTVPAQGGTVSAIAPGGRNPQFSPDGKWIAYWTGVMANDFSRDSGTRIFAVPSHGGTPVRIQPEFAASRFPVWAPDGKHLVFLGSREPGETTGAGWDWWVAPTGGGTAVRTGAWAVFRERQIRVGSPGVWTPGNDLVFAAGQGDSRNIWQIGISPGGWRVSGAPRQLTSGAGLADVPAAASGGRVVFASLAESTNIWSLPVGPGPDAVPGTPRRLTENASVDVQPAISSDGKRLVFLTLRTGNSDVWLEDLGTGKGRPITTAHTHESHPVISGDGSRIAYVHKTESWNEIHATFTDDARQAAAPLCTTDCFLPWDWSPDNRRLLYWSADQHQVGLLDVDLRQKSIVLSHPDHAILRAQFSPDGRWIAFLMVAPTIQEQVFAAPVEGMAAIAPAKWIAVAHAGVARWSPDGNSLYLVSNRDGTACIWRQRLEPASKRPVGEPVPVYHSHGARRSISGVPVAYLEFFVARDKIVFPMKESTGNIWLAAWNH